MSCLVIGFAFFWAGHHDELTGGDVFFQHANSTLPLTTFVSSRTLHWKSYDVFFPYIGGKEIKDQEIVYIVQLPISKIDFRDTLDHTLYTMPNHTDSTDNAYISSKYVPLTAFAVLPNSSSK